MIDLQPQFQAFELAIRFDSNTHKRTLAEKRQRILERLSEGIKKQRREGVTIPSYRTLNQGSYAMNTGIRPLDDDFDLDVAVIFDFEKTERPLPTTVKQWVYDAVKPHTSSVRWREPCITVYYMHKGEPKYHVDLAIYSETPWSCDLARGRMNAQSGHRSWESADPKALVEAVNNMGSNADEQAQFRRVVRPT